MPGLTQSSTSELKSEDTKSSTDEHLIEEQKVNIISPASSQPKFIESSKDEFADEFFTLQKQK